MENIKNRTIGHILALVTILIWGITFISTKILLNDFKPVEILIIRFVMGFLALWAIYPKKLGKIPAKDNILFMFAGLSGICLYYLLENISLVYTMASNCGVIMSFAPFFAAILSKIFIKSKENLGRNFFLGFLIAIIGIVLICFNGAKLKLNPLGDILALSAALVWGFYSIISKKISTLNYPLIPAVRRTFLYGILFMIPAAFLFNFNPDFSLFLKPVYLLNILFLGLGASALCFVFWNRALGVLGVVKTSVYIYLVPVITVLTSVLILKEPLTFHIVFGTLLTISGLFVSRLKKRG